MHFAFTLLFCIGTAKADNRPSPLVTYNRNHHGWAFYLNDPNNPSYPHPNIFSSVRDLIGKSKDVNMSLPVRDPRQDFTKRDVNRVYWIGHSTCLLQFKDKFIITDPVFSECASPVPYFVKRLTPIPCQIEDLPPISVVLISHNHYDHLDIKSLKRINKINPNLQIFAPLGVSNFIRFMGFKNVVEFDWRQHLIYNGIDFICFPARHGSSRIGIDFNMNLWCSWMIRDINQKIDIYFPGDTAVGPHFKEIKNTLDKQVDLVLMPIGPIEPYNFMRAIHLDPKDAYEMNKELGARKAIPIHYGTFALGVKGTKTDLEMLKEDWKDDNIDKIIVGDFVEWNGTEFKAHNRN